MTLTPQQVRDRIAENLSRLESDRRLWESCQQDYVMRMEDIQARCPHENQDQDVAQYVYEILCKDCGKVLAH